MLRVGVVVDVAGALSDTVGVSTTMANRVAAGEDSVDGAGVGLVKGEAVSHKHLHDAVHVPAFVEFGEPLGRVIVRLPMPVDSGRGQGEVDQVGCELVLRVGVGGREAGVVCLGAGDDVLDVRFPDAIEPGAGVGAVDADLGVNYAEFN